MRAFAALALSSKRGIALIIGAAAIVALAGAWLLQASGYQPCELCLKERYAYYAAVPLAALAVYAAGRWPGLARAALGALALAFAANAVLGAYHAGVEWRFWPGPSGCTGVIAGPTSVADLMKSLQHTKIVACDEAAFRILGVSLAGWSALLSAALAALGARGAAIRGN